jgi:hypothetical protein
VEFGVSILNQGGYRMAVNSITSSTYTSDISTQVKATSQSTDAKTTEAAAENANDTGVIYEPSSSSATTSSSTKTNSKVSSETIAQLKADADARLSQLKGIVEQLITKQGTAANNASIWSQFRQGVLDGSITVDEATAKQAAEDVSEDGYWGVTQTSERILDFAKTLAGGDSSKAEQMREAITKGYQQAAKLWGDDLPEISQKTYDAVMKGIDDWKNEDNASEN